MGCLEGRGPALASVGRASSRIYLSRGATLEENVFAVARGIAQWDATRDGGLADTERVALAIALPYEAMVRLYDLGLVTDEIARAMRVTVDVVVRREKTFQISFQSERRLRRATPVPLDVANDAATG